MKGKERVTQDYIEQLREITQGKFFDDQFGNLEIAKPSYHWARKVRTWNRGGWAKLSKHEYEDINQRVERLRELLPEEKHQAQLDAFYLGIKGDKMYGYIGYLNKNLWQLLLKLVRIASERILTSKSLMG